MSKSDCTRCGHPAKKHCPGNVEHTYYKHEMWPKNQAKTTCHTRHCLEALCSCTDLIEPKAA